MIQNRHTSLPVLEKHLAAPLCLLRHSTPTRRSSRITYRHSTSTHLISHPPLHCLCSSFCSNPTPTFHHTPLSSNGATPILHFSSLDCVSLLLLCSPVLSLPTTRPTLSISFQRAASPSLQCLPFLFLLFLLPTLIPFILTLLYRPYIPPLSTPTTKPLASTPHHPLSNPPCPFPTLPSTLPPTPPPPIPPPPPPSVLLLPLSPLHLIPHGCQPGKGGIHVINSR
ncbi:unnamed protein product [Closterium sp. NIES-53]